MFEKDFSGAVRFESVEESFNFTVCECQVINDCCDYFVTAKPILLSDQSTISNGTITVGNGSIVAFAQEG